MKQILCSFNHCPITATAWLSMAVLLTLCENNQEYTCINYFILSTYLFVFIINWIISFFVFWCKTVWGKDSHLMTPVIQHLCFSLLKLHFTTRVSMRSHVYWIAIVESLLRTAGAWSRVQNESSSVCLWRTIPLKKKKKMIESVLMPVVSHFFNITEDLIII